MDREQFQKACGKIATKAWTDERFEQRLLPAPTAALKQTEIDVPEGVDFKVVESTVEYCSSVCGEGCAWVSRC